MKTRGPETHWLIFYYLFIVFAPTHSFDDRNKRTLEPQTLSGTDNEVLPSNQVVGVVGFPSSLECDVSSAGESGDTLLLVLWYKEGTASPIYTFDAREGGSLTSSRHYSDDTVLSQRGRLKVSANKAILTIDPVRREDSGTFKCRADFKKSPTKNSRINLTVLVPPNKPVIRDANGRRMVGRLGPFKVGDKLIATCITSGGNPTPKVTWWRENKLIDESFEVHPGHTTNTLKLARVSKEDLNTVFTCQAVNNNRSAPVSNSLRLDITFPPVHVRILENKGRSLSNGKQTHLRCVSTGSRPMPIFRWFIGGRELIDETMTVEQNLDTLVSHSEILYVPKSSDNGKKLTCRATNEYFPEQLKEDSYTLNVHYVPIAIVSFGPNLDPGNIREGDDVYFECHVKTNPRFYNITWRLNGKFLMESIPEGIIIANQTLVLQNVQLEHAGLFTCIASNSEGDGESNAQYLNVKFAPRCRSHQRIKYGVSRKSSKDIPCLVDANPEPEVFHWKFHSRLADPSGNRRVVPIPSEHYSGDHDQSILSYSSDYIKELEGPPEKEDVVSPRNSILRNDISGYLFCWASNSVGRQEMPCKFEVVKESRPESLRHCRTENVTQESAIVTCRSGFDGGHIPSYILEVIQLSTESLPRVDFNLTNQYEPSFDLTNLHPGSTYKLFAYASNVLGRSSVRGLNMSTLKPAEKRIAEMKSKPPIPIGVGGGGGGEAGESPGNSLLSLEGIGEEEQSLESQEEHLGFTWLAIIAACSLGFLFVSFVVILLVRGRLRRRQGSLGHHRGNSSTGSGTSLHERRYDAVSTSTPEELDMRVHASVSIRQRSAGSVFGGGRRLSDCTSSLSSKNETKTCSSIIDWDVHHQLEPQMEPESNRKYSTLPRLPSYDATFVGRGSDNKFISLGREEVVSLIDDANLPLPPATFCDFPPPNTKLPYGASSRSVSKDPILLVQNRNEEGSVKFVTFCPPNIETRKKDIVNATRL